MKKKIEQGNLNMLEDSFLRR